MQIFLRFGKLFAASFLLIQISFTQISRAEPGLVIHAVEIGVAKFHRYDNNLHPYGKDHAWAASILPEEAGLTTPLLVKNSERSYTIFFSTLDEVLSTAFKLVDTDNSRIQVLNLHGHGAPGAMFFPKDKRTLDSFSCYQWREIAAAPDEENYSQYYSAMSKSDIMSIRSFSENPSVHLPCTTGIQEWKAIAAKYKDVKAYFASDAQIHFSSCVVGLGSVGEAFTRGIAELLLSGPEARVETSMNFGLGDWSMASGMGFWDYMNDEQLARDGQLYVKNRTDREIAQKGTIRVASLRDGNVTSGYLENQDFMPLDASDASREMIRWEERAHLLVLPETGSALPAPSIVRIPGTRIYADVLPLQRAFR